MNMLSKRERRAQARLQLQAAQELEAHLVDSLDISDRWPALLPERARDELRGMLVSVRIDMTKLHAEDGKS